MSVKSFIVDLERGNSRPVRYRRGDASNYWGSHIIALAQKLDRMEMSPQVAATLRELFEEIGQQGRDMVELGNE